MGVGTSKQSFSQIPLGAALALSKSDIGELSLYLPDSDGSGHVLYRQAGVGLARPDVERLRTSGLSHLLVDADQMAVCENALEEQLADLIRDPRLDSEQRAACVQTVGTAVARDLISTSDPAAHTQRVAVLVDAVVESILADSAVASNLLRVSAHHKSTASHMFSVSFFGVLLGYSTFGPDRQQLTELGLAGMLHDLGKTSIPSSILNKSTPLTPRELGVIHHHPIEAVRLLGDDSTVNSRVRQMILQHHERVDGTGYPLCLSDGDLLLGSKILTIVDSFHALIGRRTYQNAKKPAEAMRLMGYHVNSQFDSKLFESWTRILSLHLTSATKLTQPAVGDDEVSPAFHDDHKRIKKDVYARKAARLPCQSKVKVQCVYAGRLERATEAMHERELGVHDLSRAGLCMAAEHPMYPGEIVNLRVASQEQRVWVRGMVRWCRRVDRREGFFVGVQFLHRISESQVGDKTQVAGIDDQRLFPELAFAIKSAS